MGKGIIVVTSFMYLMAFCAQAALPMGMNMVAAGQTQNMDDQCESHHPAPSSNGGGMAVKYTMCCPMACCGNIVASRFDWGQDVTVVHDVPACRLFIPLPQAKGLFHPPRAVA
ncbi:MAG: hypothetical protein HZA04_00600 [Nitrospinae bacterium]|nr:hypothetical protein [Nitrospinota bacterium]